MVTWAEAKGTCHQSRGCFKDSVKWRGCVTSEIWPGSTANTTLTDRQTLSFIAFTGSRAIPLLVKQPSSHPAFLERQDQRCCLSSAVARSQHWAAVNILREGEADVHSRALYPFTDPAVHSTRHSWLFLLPPSWATSLQDRWASGPNRAKLHPLRS